MKEQENYFGKVVRIDQIRKHPNADNLAIARIYDKDIIVGIETQKGDLGVYFKVGTQLLEKFCQANELYKSATKRIGAFGGYFENNGRVKALTFRGITSEGFWLPIECLDYIVMRPVLFPPGVEFAYVLGETICQECIPGKVKIRTPQEKPKGGGVINKIREVFHIET